MDGITNLFCISRQVRIQTLVVTTHLFIEIDPFKVIYSVGCVIISSVSLHPAFTYPITEHGTQNELSNKVKHNSANYSGNEVA